MRAGHSTSAEDTAVMKMQPRPPEAVPSGKTHGGGPRLVKQGSAVCECGPHASHLPSPLGLETGEYAHRVGRTGSFP